jgi:hypothetical protein
MHSFILLAKPSAEQHAQAEWQAVISRTKQLVDAEKGMIGFKSVQQALGQDPDSAEEFYYFPTSKKDAPSIFSTKQPAPSFRKATWQPQPPEDYHPHKSDANQDAAKCRAAKQLPWEALKLVASFPPTYHWPEECAPERQASARQMLARAVPPQLATYVLDALERAGAFHCLQEQGKAATPAVISAAPPDASTVVPPQEGKRDAPDSTSREKEPNRKRPSPKPPHDNENYIFSIKFASDQQEQQREQLEKHLGVKLDENGRLPPDEEIVGGIPLESYRSKNEMVNKLLDEIKPTLPTHLLQIRVDFDGWTPSQISEVCALLSSTSNAF